MNQIYIAKPFSFDAQKKDFEQMAKLDVRARLVGLHNFLYGKGAIPICDNTAYIGPFYFETDKMKAVDIVAVECKMIEQSTHCIFILDEAACPGTITELMYALFLKKNIHVFFIKHDDTEETESDLHTPCWYPILFCKQHAGDGHINVCACTSEEEAERKVLLLVEQIQV